MPGLTIADSQDILEELYISTDRISALTFQDAPALAILDRTKAKGGRRYIHVPIRYTNPQGRSATFTDAQTNRTASNIDAFDVTWVSNYAVATVDGDVIDDAGENMELIAEAVEFEMDGSMEELRQDLSHNIFRNLGGSRGTISATSTVTATLTDPEDVAYYEIGQEINASNDDGADSGDALRDSGDTVTLTEVDRIGGILTASTTWTTDITGFTAGDHLFVEGDFAAKMSGFEGYVPAAAPGSTAFFGVDRSVDTRLGGLRSTQTGKPIEQGIMQASAEARRFGAKLNLGFMNPIDWNDLQTSIESSSNRSRTMTVQGSGDAAQFGFTALVLTGPSGDISLVADQSCQKGVVWLLQQDTWSLRYSGANLIRMINEDGLPFLREASNDGVEFRIKFRGNMACMEPGHNMRIAI